MSFSPEFTKPWLTRDTCPLAMAGDGDADQMDFLFSDTLLSQNEDIHQQVVKAEEHGLQLRPLRQSDFSRGYLNLLQQLTTVGEVSQDKFNQTFQMMKSHGTYYVLTLFDETVDRVIGSTTLFLEHKFIHSCAIRGRIEDVVVDEAVRGKNLGKLLVQTAILLAKSVHCYKLSLDCADDLKKFYSSLGFVAEEGRDNMLVIRMK